ncbi:hypothetical protein BDK51DRAFT_46797 [Blyttiomyces helicus]|uniref:Uncharacterized protein n=1 Tax=Blyttiomyces helicus TaxID=388810 RepID=A0A4P9WBR4_9FUNG|nr:hypothetical protein BDK51DRAFT_46797 [Blyttiomyces helicus]|eukprot:RKO90069.1 hypothetical protein BDK51DRAFT_46797 [Blyttiomyces helicus]
MGVKAFQPSKRCATITPFPILALKDLWKLDFSCATLVETLLSATKVGPIPRLEHCATPLGAYAMLLHGREGKTPFLAARGFIPPWIWSQLAGKAHYLCAILVVANSLVQIVFYLPYALLIINIIGGSDSCGACKAASSSTKPSPNLLTPGAPPWVQFLPSHLHVPGVQGAEKVYPLLYNDFPTWLHTYPLHLHYNTSFLNGPAPSHCSSSYPELATAVAIATYAVGSNEALAATIGPLV